MKRRRPSRGPTATAAGSWTRGCPCRSTSRPEQRLPHGVGHAVHGRETRRRGCTCRPRARTNSTIAIAAVAFGSRPTSVPAEQPRRVPRPEDLQVSRGHVPPLSAPCAPDRAEVLRITSLIIRTMCAVRESRRRSRPDGGTRQSRAPRAVTSPRPPASPRPPSPSSSATNGAAGSPRPPPNAYGRPPATSATGPTSPPATSASATPAPSCSSSPPSPPSSSPASTPAPPASPPSTASASSSTPPPKASAPPATPSPPPRPPWTASSPPPWPPTPSPPSAATSSPWSCSTATPAGSLGAATVNLDIADGVRQVADHLLDLGHRRFLHLAADVPSWTFEVRARELAAPLAAVPGTSVRTARAPISIDGALAAAEAALAAPGPGPPPSSATTTNSPPAPTRPYDASACASPTTSPSPASTTSPSPPPSTRN